MLERRTFIVRVHMPAHVPIVEDVSTGKRVRLPDLASVGAEIERRLDRDDPHPHAGGDDDRTKP